MSRKKWATLSDTALRKSAAAWNYLRHYIVSGLSAQGVRLSYGRFAKMAPDMHVLRNTDSGFVGLCLGTETWAALLWPLSALDDDSGHPCFALDYQGALEWQYFYSPDSWSVMDICVAWEDTAIYLKVQSEEPLMKFFLREPGRFNDKFDKEDFALLSERYFVAPTFGDQNLIKKLPEKDLVMSLVTFASEGDEAYVKAVEQKLRQPACEPRTHDCDDELGDSLDHLVLLDFPLEDRQDFQEVAKAVQRKNQAEWALVEKKLRNVEAKAKAKAKARSKAKASMPRVPMGKFGRRKRKATDALGDIDPVAGLQSKQQISVLFLLDLFCKMQT